MRWNLSMPRLAPLSLALSTAVLACSDGRRPPTTPPIVKVGVDGGVAAPDAAVAEAPPADPGHVAPHTGFVTGVALDRAGLAAISIDSLGATRLWRRLDGTTPPIAVPLRGVRSVDVITAGDRTVVGAIDPMGAAHLLTLDHDGGVMSFVDLPATPPAVGILALSADAWLVARADQSVVLADRGGIIRDEWVRDAVRIEALRPIGRDGALVVLVAGGDAPTATALTLEAVAGKLRVARELPLAIAPLAPVEIAASPDGKHLAYFADPAVVKAALSAGPPAASKPRPDPVAGAPAMRRPPPPPPQPTAQVVIVDATTGANVTPKALAGLSIVGPQRIGFTSSDSVGVYMINGDVSSGLAADADVITSNVTRNSPPAVAAGRMVAGSAQNLVVVDGSTVRYLGYQFAAANAVALSPDGSRSAVAVQQQILIGPADGSGARTKVDLDDTAATLAFVDADHVLAVTFRGQLLLIARDGSIVARGTAPGSPHGSQWSPSGRWLVGLRDGGGVWAVRVDVGSRPGFGKPHAIADGSFSFWLLEATADTQPALVTTDGSAKIRTYTGAHLAAGVPVNKVSTIPSRQLPAAPFFIDGAGRAYGFGGANLTRIVTADDNANRGDVAEDEVFVPVPLSTVQQVKGLPGATAMLLADQGGTARLVTADGAEKWAVSGGTTLTQIAVSGDGRYAALLSSAGALLVDVTTGTALAAQCGWEFGAWPSPPQPFNLGVESMCEAR